MKRKMPSDSPPDDPTAAVPTTSSTEASSMAVPADPSFAGLLLFNDSSTADTTVTFNHGSTMKVHMHVLRSAAQYFDNLQSFQRLADGDGQDQSTGSVEFEIKV
ncbi:hypothetical protein HKX48_009120 [Thoreauomyces humboldtii]|nr:hypothetical protein HKX48_009120 [Thoreauomyces humboldtii]